MALHYQTEYRLGNRGRVCRSYTGFQAFVAIGLDLVFGLFFELVSTLVALAMRIALLTVRFAMRVLRIHWRILVAAMTFVVYIVTLPFAWVHQGVDRLRSGGPSGLAGDPIRPAPVVKPSWALSREV
jgi:hypothetical protein